MNKSALGKEGEELALLFLKKQGYKIIERNFRSKYGELDIIGYQDKAISFIEVKTRQREELGPPEEAVNLAKKKQLIRVARYYLKRKKIPENIPCRFDVVSIILTKPTPQFKLIKNAFG